MLMDKVRLVAARSSCNLHSKQINLNLSAEAFIRESNGQPDLHHWKERERERNNLGFNLGHNELVLEVAQPG